MDFIIVTLTIDALAWAWYQSLPISYVQGKMSLFLSLLVLFCSLYNVFMYINITLPMLILDMVN